MFGGVRARASLGLVLSAGFGLATVPALAADLGSGGVEDLEERIAELEATTARKGNRKVSLTISGYVNEQIQWWDDGNEQNVYVGTNESSQTRFRFVGKAKINADLSAGYIIEVGLRGGDQGKWGQDDIGSSNSLNLRHSAWYLESSTLGKVTVGYTSASNDGITELTLVNSITVAKPIQIFTPNGGFNLRLSDGSRANATWKSLSRINAAGEGDRFNVIRYDSPEIAGFTASASWGDDDLWAVALQYQGELHGFKLAGGIGYSEVAGTVRGFGNSNLGHGSELGLSVSALHKETGLFATFAYGEANDEGRPEDNDYVGWNIQAGIQRKWSTLGKTTLYGEYYEGNFGTAGANLVNAGGGLGATTIAGSDVDVWGLAAIQSIDAASLDLYIAYRHYEVDLALAGELGGGRGDLTAKDFDTVFSGARINF